MSNRTYLAFVVAGACIGVAFLTQSLIPMAIGLMIEGIILWTANQEKRAKKEEEAQRKSPEGIAWAKFQHMNSMYRGLTMLVDNEADSLELYRFHPDGSPEYMQALESTIERFTHFEQQYRQLVEGFEKILPTLSLQYHGVVNTTIKATKLRAIACQKTHQNATLIKNQHEHTHTQGAQGA